MPRVKSECETQCLPLLEEDSCCRTELPRERGPTARVLLAKKMLPHPHFDVRFALHCQFGATLRVVPHNEAFNLHSLKKPHIALVSNKL